MKILVTGAAGFIGSHTCHELGRQGHTVIGLDDFNEYYDSRQKRWNQARLESAFPRNFRMITGDILDEKLLRDVFESEKPEKVCHLAARAGVRPSIADPFLYETVNIRGTLNILEQCRLQRVKKLVYASSSSVYGDCRDVPFRETLPLKPISPYAATKLNNENDAHVYSHLHGLSTVGLRFFTVYGPAGRPDMAPFLFTRWIDTGIPLKKFGDGSTSRDYTYIDDIVAGIIAALELQTEYDVFNLGNSASTTLNDFISLIEKLLGKTANILEMPLQPGDVTTTFADITRAKQKLGFTPKTDLETGMTAFIDWYRQHRAQLFW